MQFKNIQRKKLTRKGVSLALIFKLFDAEDILGMVSVLAFFLSCIKFLSKVVQCEFWVVHILLGIILEATLKKKKRKRKK